MKKKDAERALQERALNRYFDLFYSKGDQSRWIINFGLVRRVLPFQLKTGQLALCEFNFAAINAISNEINRLFLLIYQLQIWQDTLGAFTKDERHLITLFWVEPNLNLALLTPYNLKQRIIYCATKSLLVEYASRKGSKVIRLPQDHEISFKTLLKWCKEDDPLHLKLVHSIERLDAPSPFWSRNYRRKHVHRIPPCLLLGLQTYVDIETDGRGYTETVEVHRPISLEDSMGWLSTEHKLLRNSFASLLRMFRSQMSASMGY
jgi:hypothetical protein